VELLSFRQHDDQLCKWVSVLVCPSVELCSWCVCVLTVSRLIKKVMACELSSVESLNNTVSHGL
jgi:hypothetical protein